MSLKINTISSNQKYATCSWSARIGSTKICIVTRKYKTTYESSTESSEPWSSLLAKPKGSWLHTNSQVIILILVCIDSIINKGPAHTRKIQWEDHKWVNFPSHCCPSQQCAPVECQAQECLWLSYPHPAIHHVQSRTIAIPILQMDLQHKVGTFQGLSWTTNNNTTNDRDVKNGT